VSSPEIAGDAYDEPEEGAVEKVLPDRELLGFRDFRKASSQHITIGVAAIRMTPNKNQASQASATAAWGAANGNVHVSRSTRPGEQ
jgi:hypothetical protein